MLGEKIQKQRILINASMSIIQVVVVSIVLFVLYKFLLSTIGVEQLGIWSLTLATTSISQITNLGLSGSVVKFVAQYIARGENEQVSLLIQTSAISMALIFGIFMFICYPIAKWLLILIISDSNLLIYARTILPITFLALWLMTISSIFQSSLDGYQCIYVRNIILMGGSLLNLALCLILVPYYGLVGVAYARVFQYVLVLISSWLLLRRYLPILPVIPFKWHTRIFKEIIGYGFNFQVLSILNMLFDPITKALLSKFGGLTIVGYYEMASRMIIQLRALIVSASQVLVPAIAELKEKTPNRLQSFYLETYRLLFYIAVFLYSLIFLSIPLISELWVGYYEKVFVLFATLLCVGWFLNTLNVPAYFTNLGDGELRWNMIGQTSVALLNISLGYLLGFYYGGSGVVIGWVVSLALGSSIVYLSFHIKHKIPLIELIPTSSRSIIIITIIGISLASILRYSNHHSSNIILLNSLIVLAFLISGLISFWLNPMRKSITANFPYEFVKSVKLQIKI